MEPRYRKQLAELGPVFTAAEARAAGVRADRLSRAGAALRLARAIYVDREFTALGTPHRGAAIEQAAAPAGSDSEHPDLAWRRSQVERARLLSRKLPAGAFFSHHTAAALWRLPVPARAGDELDLGIFGASHSSRSAAFRSHRFELGAVSVTRVNNVPVTDPASTWLALAMRLPRRDAIALGDAVLHAPRFPGTTRLKRQPLARIEEIRRLLARPRRPGRRIVGELAELLSPHAASVPETHLRLQLAEWGMPAPDLDFDVTDDHGTLLGCSELAYARWRLAIEYEGDHHRTDAVQSNRDIEKYRAYAANGWEVLRVTAQLLYREPQKLRAQLEEALDRRA
ncbi:hypothetical protein ACI1US_01822 [Leucobacter sp. BZR 635]